MIFGRMFDSISTSPLSFEKSAGTHGRRIDLSINFQIRRRKAPTVNRPLSKNQKRRRVNRTRRSVRSTRTFRVTATGTITARPRWVREAIQERAQAGMANQRSLFRYDSLTVLMYSVNTKSSCSGKYLEMSPTFSRSFFII